MFMNVLEQGFDEAERESALERSDRGIDHLDARQAHFKHLKKTVELVPQLLCAHADAYLSRNELDFFREFHNLRERTGHDFFPETAADFVWKLLRNLVSVSRPYSARQSLPRAPETTGVSGLSIDRDSSQACPVTDQLLGHAGPNSTSQVASPLGGLDQRH